MSAIKLFVYGLLFFTIISSNATGFHRDEYSMVQEKCPASYDYVYTDIKSTNRNQDIGDYKFTCEKLIYESIIDKVNSKIGPIFTLSKYTTTDEISDMITVLGKLDSKITNFESQYVSNETILLVLDYLKLRIVLFEDELFEKLEKLNNNDKLLNSVIDEVIAGEEPIMEGGSYNTGDGIIKDVKLYELTSGINIYIPEKYSKNETENRLHAVDMREPYETNDYAKELHNEELFYSDGSYNIRIISIYKDKTLSYSDVEDYIFQYELTSCHMPCPLIKESLRSIQSYDGITGIKYKRYRENEITYNYVFSVNNMLYNIFSYEKLDNIVLDIHFSNPEFSYYSQKLYGVTVNSDEYMKLTEYTPFSYKEDIPEDYILRGDTKRSGTLSYENKDATIDYTIIQRSSRGYESKNRVGVEELRKHIAGWSLACFNVGMCKPISSIETIETLNGEKGLHYTIGGIYLYEFSVNNTFYKFQTQEDIIDIIMKLEFSE